MSAHKHARASRRGDEDDDRKGPATEADSVLPESVQGGGAPALLDLGPGAVESTAWLALQQTIGNRAVGGLVEQRRAGQPLPPKIRHDMEASFGRSFGQVQTHSGPEVDQAAEALDAAAFTVADDIFVRSDFPDFDQPLGREVLGEELAHVAQGTGRERAERVTTPSETAEREAHEAGLAAATGAQVRTQAAPEAAGAVARFDLSGVLDAAAEAVAAATAGPTELKDEEKVRLGAGALTPLKPLLDRLIQVWVTEPKSDKLTPIAVNAEGIGDFILSFNGPPSVQPTIESAAQAVINGRQALLGAIEPEKATKATARILGKIGAEIEGLATIPPAAAAPGAAPAATPSAAPAETLSAAEADQIKLGAALPLNSASQQLNGENPDLELIIARIKGVPGVLRSFSKPAAVAQQLHAKAMDVEGQVSRLEAIQGGPQVAIQMAVSQWQTAIGLLYGLTAKPTSAGASSSPEAPAPGDDTGKNSGTVSPPKRPI